MIAIAVAGREHDDAALGLAGRARRRVAAYAASQAAARALRVVLRQRRVALDAERALEQLAPDLRAVESVHCLGDDRNARDAAHGVGRAQDLVARARLAVFEVLHLRAQHQVREVDVPFVRRHVRALRHVAHVAEIAVLDDGPVGLARHVVQLAARRRVHGVEQRREGVAEAEAAPAAVADVEDARELLVERGRIGELGRAPIDRVARRRFETALAARSLGVSHRG